MTLNLARQIPYEPLSKGPRLECLVPQNLAVPTRIALQDLDRRLKADGFEDVDHFLVDRLGYGSRQELWQALAAEQCDFVALAIDQFERGGSFINGSMTGMGKGRHNAALIRYADRRGILPIFFTERPDLYAALARDLADIGSGHLKLLATDAGLTGAKAIDLPDGTRLTTRPKEAHDRVLDEIVRTGELGPHGDVLVSSYSQMQTVKGNETSRRRLMASVAPGALLLRDETQNAAGDGLETKPGLPPNRAEFLRNIMWQAEAVGDSSATWAKRPDILDLYARTDLRMAAPIAEIGGVAARGGVPMLQALSGMLAQAGQYGRLERDLSGVEYVFEVVDTDHRMVDRFAAALRAIYRFSEFKEGLLAGKVGNRLRQTAQKALPDGATGKVGLDSLNFSSLVHNLTAQGLLAIKAEPAAAEAIALLKRGETNRKLIDAVHAAEGDRHPPSGWADLLSDAAGDDGVLQAAVAEIRHLAESPAAAKAWLEKDGTIGKDRLAAFLGPRKPVFGLHNTMGSFIEQFASDTDGKPGEVLGADFGDLLIRYLDRTRDVLIGDPFGAKERIRLTDGDLGADGMALYREARKLIGETDWTNMHVSPIDHVKWRLESAGFDVGEITGRHHVLDYSQGEPVYRVRPPAEVSKAQAVRTKDAFNAGRLDAVIINQSGASGIDLHAARKFSDRTPRAMLLLQAHPNVDTHVQMLGRIDRTDQEFRGSYRHLVADVPAELRPAAALAKKLATLNATTMATRDGVFGSGGLDILNPIGDRAIARLMEIDSAMHWKMGFPLKLTSKGDGLEVPDAARKVTGRMALLAVREQERLARMIEEEYASELRRAEAMGESLEAKTLDLRARPVERVELGGTAGADKVSSPFAGPYWVYRMDVRRLQRPYRWVFVEQRLRDELAMAKDTPSGEYHREAARWTAARRKELSARFSSFLARRLEGKDDKRKVGIQKRLAAQFKEVDDTLANLPPGTRVRVELPQQPGDDARSVVYGVVAAVKPGGRTANPAAPGDWRLHLIVADAMREIDVPFSQIAGVGKPKGQEFVITRAEKAVVTENGKAVTKPIPQLFDEGARQAREERLVVTGNLLAGYARYPRGQVMFFTDEQGAVRPGILLPKDADMAAVLAAQPVAFSDPDHVLDYLEDGIDARKRREILSSDGAIAIRAANPGEEAVVDGRLGAIRIDVAAARSVGGRYFLDQAVVKAAGADFVSVGGEMRVTVPAEQFGAVFEALKAAGATFVTRHDLEDARAITGMELPRPETTKELTGAVVGAALPPSLSTPAPESERAAQARPASSAGKEAAVPAGAADDNRRLLVIACTQSKAPDSGEIPAVDRYTGYGFDVLKAQLASLPADARPDVVILSARHGFIPGDRPIAAYDEMLTPDAANRLKRDAATAAAVEDLLGRGSYKDVMLFGSELYRDVMRSFTHHFPAGAAVTEVSGGVLAQKAQLKQWLLNGRQAIGREAVADRNAPVRDRESLPAFVRPPFVRPGAPRYGFAAEFSVGPQDMRETVSAVLDALDGARALWPDVERDDALAAQLRAAAALAAVGDREGAVSAIGPIAEKIRVVAEAADAWWAIEGRDGSEAPGKRLLAVLDGLQGKFAFGRDVTLVTDGFSEPKLLSGPSVPGPTRDGREVHRVLDVPETVTDRALVERFDSSLDPGRFVHAYSRVLGRGPARQFSVGDLPTPSPRMMAESAQAARQLIGEVMDRHGGLPMETAFAFGMSSLGLLDGVSGMYRVLDEIADGRFNDPAAVQRLAERGHGDFLRSTGGMFPTGDAVERGIEACVELADEEARDGLREILAPIARACWAAEDMHAALGIVGAGMADGMDGRFQAVDIAREVLQLAGDPTMTAAMRETDHILAHFGRMERRARWLGDAEHLADIMRQRAELPQLRRLVADLAAGEETLYSAGRSHHPSYSDWSVKADAGAAELEAMGWIRADVPITTAEGLASFPGFVNEAVAPGLAVIPAPAVTATLSDIDPDEARWRVLHVASGIPLGAYHRTKAGLVVAPYPHMYTAAAAARAAQNMAGAADWPTLVPDELPQAERARITQEVGSAFEKERVADIDDWIGRGILSFDAADARSRGFDVDNTFWIAVDDGERPEILIENGMIRAFPKREHCADIDGRSQAPVHLRVDRPAYFGRGEVASDVKEALKPFFDQNEEVLRDNFRKAIHADAAKIGEIGGESPDTVADRAAATFSFDSFIEAVALGDWRMAGAGRYDGSLLDFILLHLKDAGYDSAVMPNQLDVGEEQVFVFQPSRVTMAWNQVEASITAARARADEERARDAAWRAKYNETERSRMAAARDEGIATFDVDRLEERGFNTDSASIRWVAVENKDFPAVGESFTDAGGTVYLRRSDAENRGGAEAAPVYLRHGFTANLAAPGDKELAVLADAHQQLALDSLYPSLLDFQQAVRHGRWPGGDVRDAVLDMFRTAGFHSVEYCDVGLTQLHVFDASDVAVAWDALYRARLERRFTDAVSGPALAAAAQRAALAAPRLLLGGPDGTAQEPARPRSSVERAAEVRALVGPVPIIGFVDDSGAMRLFDADARRAKQLLPDLTVVEIDEMAEVLVQAHDRVRVATALGRQSCDGFVAASVDPAAGHLVVETFLRDEVKREIVDDEKAASLLDNPEARQRERARDRASAWGQKDLPARYADVEISARRHEIPALKDGGRYVIYGERAERARSAGGVLAANFSGAGRAATTWIPDTKDSLLAAGQVLADAGIELCLSTSYDRRSHPWVVFKMQPSTMAREASREATVVSGIGNTEVGVHAAVKHSHGRHGVALVRHADDASWRSYGDDARHIAAAIGGDPVDVQDPDGAVHAMVEIPAAREKELVDRLAAVGIAAVLAVYAGSGVGDAQVSIQTFQPERRKEAELVSEGAASRPASAPSPVQPTESASRSGQAEAMPSAGSREAADADPAFQHWQRVKEARGTRLVMVRDAGQIKCFEADAETAAGASPRCASLLRSQAMPGGRARAVLFFSSYMSASVVDDLTRAGLRVTLVEPDAQGQLVTRDYDPPQPAEATPAATAPSVPGGTQLRPDASISLAERLRHEAAAKAAALAPPTTANALRIHLDEALADLNGMGPDARADQLTAVLSGRGLLNASLHREVARHSRDVFPLSAGYVVFRDPITQRWHYDPMEQFISRCGPDGRLAGAFARAAIDVLADWTGRYIREIDASFAHDLAEAKAEIMDFAAEMNPDVDVRFVDRLFADGRSMVDSGVGTADRNPVLGMYFRNFNVLAVSTDLSRGDPVETAYHELYHSLAPLLTPKELAILAERFPARGTRTAEEAAAEAFSEWALDKAETLQAVRSRHSHSARHGDIDAVRGDSRDASHSADIDGRRRIQLPAWKETAVADAFDTLGRFLEKANNVLRGRGFQTWDDIFIRVRTGDVVRRAKVFDVAATIDPREAARLAKGAGLMRLADSLTHYTRRIGRKALTGEAVYRLLRAHLSDEAILDGLRRGGYHAPRDLGGATTLITTRDALAAVDLDRQRQVTPIDVGSSLDRAATATVRPTASQPASTAYTRPAPVAVSAKPGGIVRPMQQAATVSRFSIGAGPDESLLPGDGWEAAACLDGAIGFRVRTAAQILAASRTRSAIRRAKLLAEVRELTDMAVRLEHAFLRWAETDPVQADRLRTRFARVTGAKFLDPAIGLQHTLPIMGSAGTIMEAGVSDASMLKVDGVGASSGEHSMPKKPGVEIPANAVALYVSLSEHERLRREGRWPSDPEINRERLMYDVSSSHWYITPDHPMFGEMVSSYGTHAAQKKWEAELEERRQAEALVFQQTRDGTPIYLAGKDVEKLRRHPAVNFDRRSGLFRVRPGHKDSEGLVAQYSTSEAMQAWQTERGEKARLKAAQGAARSNEITGLVRPVAVAGVMGAGLAATAAAARNGTLNDIGANLADAVATAAEPAMRAVAELGAQKDGLLMQGEGIAREGLGAIKEAAGSALGNATLTAEGVRDQVVGAAQQVAGDRFAREGLARLDGVDVKAEGLRLQGEGALDAANASLMPGDGNVTGFSDLKDEAGKLVAEKAAEAKIAAGQALEQASPGVEAGIDKVRDLTDQVGAIAGQAGDRIDAVLDSGRSFAESLAGDPIHGVAAPSVNPIGEISLDSGRSFADSLAGDPIHGAAVPSINPINEVGKKLSEISDAMMEPVASQAAQAATAAKASVGDAAGQVVSEAARSIGGDGILQAVTAKLSAAGAALGGAADAALTGGLVSATMATAMWAVRRSMRLANFERAAKEAPWTLTPKEFGQVASRLYDVRRDGNKVTLVDKVNGKEVFAFSGNQKVSAREAVTAYHLAIVEQAKEKGLAIPERVLMGHAAEADRRRSSEHDHLGDRGRRVLGLAGDRKSTRLNSSHRT